MKGSESRRQGEGRDGISCVFLLQMNCTMPSEEEMKMREWNRLRESQRLRGYFEAETKEKNYKERAHS